MKIFNLKALLILILLAAFAGCQSHYALVKSGRGEYHMDSTLAVDSGVIKTYLPYKQKMEAQMNAVLGQSAIAMPKSDSAETYLGNFYADATAAEARKIASFDFAIPTTKGGLRYAIPKGNVTLDNIFELMPFENELVLLKLKGTDVQQLLNFIAASGGQPVNGLRMTIKNRQPAEIIINGSLFNPNRTYTVLTSDYLANGGDNTKGMATPVERKNIGLRVRDALINYVKQQTAAGKTINVQLDGRITKN
ncbi:5'-nucleotidase [Mucilaginibacter terrae]|uniref:2',3'-cyclic-nucleotide 2'-phosphodiesterase (5'-nucleotidase family) n=1 Tax=Mucilaginibacter terrae TaxID=1955052 RepID=A0ABU3GQN0_9SPHI|nr:5'-nucleotidase [Mucilaginibacter terrae]MDT3402084.1 2',3'-cyclic-nucleotide 2'-phosphodiesterase (5'-nucleotidase family) [Mucilaginibacter terrae]